MERVLSKEAVHEEPAKLVITYLSVVTLMDGVQRESDVLPIISPSLKSLRSSSIARQILKCKEDNLPPDRVIAALIVDNLKRKGIHLVS